jgi:cobalt-zinc-cadmium efflux system protein
MQFTPPSMDINQIQKIVEEHPGVSNIHHLHIWNLTDQEVHLEAHIEMIDNLRLNEVSRVHEEIEKLLMDRFQIHHITLQYEYNTDHKKPLVVTDE